MSAGMSRAHTSRSSISKIGRRPCAKNREFRQSTTVYPSILAPEARRSRRRTPSSASRPNTTGAIRHNWGYPAPLKNALDHLYKSARFIKDRHLWRTWWRKMRLSAEAVLKRPEGRYQANTAPRIPNVSAPAATWPPASHASGLSEDFFRPAWPLGSGDRRRPAARGCRSEPRSPAGHLTT